MSERITGTVKWFNGSKGYGFITPDNSENDVFVHHSAIQEQSGFRDLNEGDRVEMAIEDTPKGPQAINVVRLSD